jgi:hypothetical protein
VIVSGSPSAFQPASLLAALRPSLFEASVEPSVQPSLLASARGLLESEVGLGSTFVVEVISRFRTGGEQKRIIERLADGSIDEVGAIAKRLERWA